MEYIITFKTTNHAIKAEQTLLEHNFQVGVLPLPTQISAGCGISLRIKSDDIKPALEALTQRKIDKTGVYTRVTVNTKHIYTEAQI